MGVSNTSRGFLFFSLLIPLCHADLLLCAEFTKTHFKDEIVLQYSYEGFLRPSGQLFSCKPPSKPPHLNDILSTQNRFEKCRFFYPSAI